MPTDEARLRAASRIAALVATSIELIVGASTPSSCGVAMIASHG